MPVKILLADKSITIQKVVEMLFSGRDYEVLCASDGETALSEATRVVPDVMLADVDLPRLDGYSLAAKLKQNSALAQIPVILMMSRDDVYDGVKGKQSGIQDSIAKPFESQELIGKVKKALAAAGPRPAEPAAPPRSAAPVAPPRPVPPTAPAKAKKPEPADIFDIISEAPSQADLMREAATDEEEALYEVEPVVEEVEEPMVREETKILPVGAKAVEEMRAGLGLTEWEEESQPEVVTFESLAKTMKADQQAAVKKSVPSPAPAAPRPSQPPVQQPMVSASDVWGIAEDTVAKMAKDVFDQMPPIKPQQLSDDKLRSIAEDIFSRMARDMFKDMRPPVPKISEDTVRRGIADAVTAIAREIAREVIEKVAWEVIPQLAEVLIKEEIERLKEEQ